MSIIVWERLTGNEAGSLIKLDGGIIVGAYLEEDATRVVRSQQGDHVLQQASAQLSAADIGMNRQCINPAPSLGLPADHSDDPSDNLPIDFCHADDRSMGAEQVTNSARIESFAGVDEASMFDAVDRLCIGRHGGTNDHRREMSLM